VTHEPELTSAVDLCLPDGGPLNPAARGWSRRPLHRANLDGGDPGRNKRWDYWAVLAGDVVVSCVYSDIDVLGLADTWWAELTTGRSGGRGIITEPGLMRLPQMCGTAGLHVDRDGLALTIDAEDEAGTRLRASWSEDDGRPGSFDIRISRPAGLESVNVVVPWSDDTFNFTSKQVARPATGVLRVGHEEFALGADGDAWGVLDVGRGRWPVRATWNWGAASGRAAGTVVGLQLGAKWTEGTGATENGFVLDGRVTKLGQELHWSYSWDDPNSPWVIEDPGGQLSVVLTPRYDKYTLAGDDDLGSEVHQVFGTYAGRVVDDDGRTVEFSGLQGFAEEARQAW
jgi:hypothetical protein